MDEFKRFFFRGLAAVLPTLLSIALFIWAYNLVDNYIGQYVTLGMRKAISLTGPPQAVNALTDALEYGQPINEWNDAGQRLTVEYKIITHKALHSPDDQIRKSAERRRTEALWRIAFAKYKLNFVGFLVAIIVVYFVGRFLASLLGRQTWKIVERLLTSVPFVRAIYPNIKQVTDFLFGERQYEFSGVVAVQYPRKGIWSLGFLTGSPMIALAKATPEELVTIFVPSSPTPMTGYTITVPRSDTLDLAISVDEALRFTISAGVIKPHTQLAGGGDESTVADSKEVRG